MKSPKKQTLRDKVSSLETRAEILMERILVLESYVLARRGPPGGLAEQSMQQYHPGLFTPR
jgi:hypothetical protein